MLYKALSKAISYKKNKKKATLNKKAGLLKIMITIMISTVLFALNKDLFLYWIFLCLIMLISKTVSLVSRLFSNEKGLHE